MFRLLTRTQIVADVTIASLFGLVAVVFTIPVVLSPGVVDSMASAFAALVLSLVFAVVLGLRRYAPGIALGIAWVAAIIQMLCQLPPLPANLAILGVLYTCAAYGSVRLFWTAFVSSVVGASVITVYLLIPTLSNIFVSPGETLVGYVFAGGALFLSSALGLMLAWTVGALVRVGVTARASAEARRRAEDRAASESERNRIARDMHDVVAHSLAVVIAQADGARYAVAASTDGATGAGADAASEALQTISTTARSALSDVRMLLTQLRHSQAQGPQPTVADLEALYAQVRRAGVDLRVDVDPTPPGEPPAAVQIAVYRILQEALTNALRHGVGGRVDVSLSWLAERVEVSVSNPSAGSHSHAAQVSQVPRVSRVGEPVGEAAGESDARIGELDSSVDEAVGGSPAARASWVAEPGAPVGGSTGGHGLVGMRERAQLIGGWFEAVDRDGTFTVRASLPIRGAA